MIKWLILAFTGLLWIESCICSWGKCDVKICAADVLAARRWTSVMTAKVRGYGQYQVPHQKFDWNHKTVADSARPWPVPTRLVWAGQNGSPRVRCGAVDEPNWLACSLHPLPGHALTVYLSAILPSVTSLQPFPSALPFGLIFPWAACFNQAQGLIDSSYHRGSVLCFVSRPLPLTGRLSEPPQSPTPAASIYHEEGPLCLRLSLISSIFNPQPPTPLQSKSREHFLANCQRITNCENPSASCSSPFTSTSASSCSSANHPLHRRLSLNIPRIHLCSGWPTLMETTWNSATHQTNGQLCRVSLGYPIKMHVCWILFLFLNLSEDRGTHIGLICRITSLLFPTARLSLFKQMANDDVSSAWRD